MWKDFQNMIKTVSFNKTCCIRMNKEVLEVELNVWKVKRRKNQDSGTLGGSKWQSSSPTVYFGVCGLLASKIMRPNRFRKSCSSAIVASKKKSQKLGEYLLEPLPRPGVVTSAAFLAADWKTDGSRHCPKAGDNWVGTVKEPRLVNGRLGSPDVPAKNNKSCKFQRPLILIAYPMGF